MSYLDKYKRNFLIMLLCIFAILPSVFAKDLIVSRSYWEDTSNLATLEDAQKNNFQQYSGVLSRGYTQSAIWIQLEVSPSQGMKADYKLILRIRPIYLDEITLYDPLDTSGKLRVTGDRTNYSDEEYKSLAHTFVIPAGDKPRHIWLRLKATSTSLINVEAFTAEDMLAHEYKLLISYCLVLSLIVVFLVLVFINWLNYREYLYAAFVVRHVLYLIYTASFFGFHRYVLDGVVDAKFLDVIYNWFVVGATAFSLWFERKFLQEYSPPQWAKYVINGLILWSACAATLLLFGEIHQALKVNMLLNGVGIVVLFITASIFIDDKKAKEYQVSSLLKKRVVVGYYAAITALLMFSVLPYMGAMAGNEFSINGLVFYALCSGMVMTVLMQLRANQLRQTNAQYQQDLLLAGQHRELEKIRLEEQSQLLAMLMHEIKTPLAVIDLAQQATSDFEAQGYVARNVEIIKNILNRCLNADRVALGKLNANFQEVFINDLLDDLRAQHEAHANRIEIEVGSSIETLSTDYQCLQIILNNLVDNALRYGDEAQAVEIQIVDKFNAAGEAGIALTVANKTGIASWPDPELVFHKYYRSIGAQSISGTGLGLFLAASMSKIIGGSCAYVPDDTHVRFELWLPT
jgi:signal transduction histidine kinase